MSIRNKFQHCFLYRNLKILVVFGLTVSCGRDDSQVRESFRTQSDSGGHLQLSDEQLGGMSEEMSIQTYHRELGNRIARRALRQNAGRSLGQCWKYANDAVTGRGGTRMGMYAWWFYRNTTETERRRDFGLCTLLKEPGVREWRIREAPKGSIIGYKPGRHGFHRRYGHGEVKVRADYYCSDFCTSRTQLTADFILYPCRWGRYN